MFNAIHVKVPFLRLFLAFVLGIIVRMQIDTPDLLLYLIIGASFLSLLILIPINKNPCPPPGTSVRGILILVCFFCLGAVPIATPVSEYHPPCVMISTVFSVPVQKKSYYKVLLGDTGFPAEDASLSGKILAYLEQGSSAGIPQPGNKLMIYSDLKQIAPPLNPYEFDFQSWYSRKDIYYRMFIPAGHWEILDTGSSGGLKIIAESWRYRFSRKLKHLFPEEDEFAVLNALFLGNKDYLDPEEKNKFSRAGAMHFLAVSGLHTGIVFYILHLLFRLVPGKNRSKSLRTFLIISLLWLYALLTGLSVSTMRATAMLSLWLIAEMIQREMHPMNNLFLTAFIILLINPAMVMDIGFQLSFLAVGGILLFYPPMHRTLRTGKRTADAIISLILISICAQFSTLPLSVYYFHYLSHYFVLTNLLITPLITVLIYAAPLFFLCGILSLIEQPLQVAVHTLTELLLSTVDFINDLPASYSEGYFPAPLTVILLYVMIMAALSLITFRQPGMLKWVLLSLLAILVLRLAEQDSAGRESKLLVYHIPGSTAVNILGGTDNLLIAAPDLQMSYDWPSMVQFWKKEHVAEAVWVQDEDSFQINPERIYLRHCGLQDYSIWFIQLENYRIGIIESFEIRDEPAGIRLPELDYLVVTNNCIQDIKLHKLISGKTTVILDGSNSISYTRKLSEDCREQGIPVHITARQGCFRLSAKGAEKIVKALDNY